MNFERKQDQLLQVKHEHPDFVWVEGILRDIEHRALVAELRKVGQHWVAP